MTDVIRRNLRTPKGGLTAVFVVLFGLAAASAGWSNALPHVAAAVLGACSAELLVRYFDRQPLRWPSSALLSGMIVGFVLAPITPWPVTLAIAFLATLSKYLFATSRWHIFNPAALALLVSVPLFGTAQSWWGALPDLPWPFLVLLIAGGVFIVDRINKFPLVLAYLATLFALVIGFGRVDVLTAAELLRTPFVQATLFLAFFMLTDPPTAPSRYRDQVVIGVLAAAASVAAEWLGAGQTYLLIGVLVGNVGLAARRWFAGRARTKLSVFQAATQYGS